MKKEDMKQELDDEELDGVSGGIDPNPLYACFAEIAPQLRNEKCKRCGGTGTLMTFPCAPVSSPFKGVILGKLYCNCCGQSVEYVFNETSKQIVVAP